MLTTPSPSFEEWTENTAPTLSRMRQCAWWLSNYSKELLHKARLIKGVPEWRTEAEVAIDNCIRDLETARAEIVGAVGRLESAKIELATKRKSIKFRKETTNA